MIRRFTQAAAVTALVLFAGAAIAQRPFGGFGGGGAGFLLMNPDVQTELKLSEEQITKSKEVGQSIREKYKDKFAELKDTPQDQRREKFQELMKTVSTETDKAHKDVLNADQQKRLKQLELQAKGAEALTEADVEKALNLTAEQKDKIKTIREDAGKEMREIFQNAQGNFQEAIGKIQTLRKETTEKTLATLTDAQKKTWKEMTGAPFEFKLRRPNTNQ